jgi:adenine-specific DNA-methyltransferase
VGSAAAALAWAVRAGGVPIASDLVPGADEPERRLLTALGGIAAELAGPDRVGMWPGPLAVWAQNAPEPPPDVIRGLRDDTINGADVLADLYAAVVSGRNRRRLGTFFTPPRLAAHMVAAAGRMLGDPPATVVDPGAGVGAFTVAAARAWPNAAVEAVDVNVVTLGLLDARSAVLGLKPATLTLDDYLAWARRDLASTPGPRVTLGNPPYTRHQLMTAKEKQEAAAAAGELITSGLAGLSAYFTAVALDTLEPDDALALLLPAPWVVTRYGREIRQRLREEARRHVEVQHFPPDLVVFPGTQVSAVVLLVGPQRARRQAFSIKAARIGALGGVLLGSPQRCAREGAGAALPSPAPKVSAAVNVENTERSSGNGIALGEIATVRRGCATGANRFFFLDDEQAACIPEQALVPAVVKAAHVPGLHLNEAAHEQMGRDGLPRWLLMITDAATLALPEVQKYLALGTAEGVHLGHLTSMRKNWWAVEPVLPPHIVLSPVGRTSFRVIVNGVRAVPSNSLYGLYLKPLSHYTAAALAAWLRSDEGQGRLRGVARVYAGGSMKIEPKALRQLRVPSERELVDGG